MGALLYHTGCSTPLESFALKWKPARKGEALTFASSPTLWRLAVLSSTPQPRDPVVGGGAQDFGVCVAPTSTAQLLGKGAGTPTPNPDNLARRGRPDQKKRQTLASLMSVYKLV